MGRTGKTQETVPQKKQKTTKGSSSRQQPPPQPQSTLGYDHTRFYSDQRYARFEVIRKWNFHPETSIRLVTPEYQYINQEIFRRHWGTLARPLEKFDPMVVKEFYANAHLDKNERKIEYAATVRGVEVSYSREALSNVLGIGVYPEIAEDYYHRRVKGYRDPQFTIEELERSLCLEGREASLNSQKTRKTHFSRRNLKQSAQIWMYFVLHNILPVSHTSSITVANAPLLFCLLGGHDIDICKYISEEIRRRIRSDASTGVLGYPALITRLCREAGVPGVVCTEPIENPIDEGYISKECREDSGAPPPREKRRPGIEEQLQFLMLQNEFIMDRQDVLMHRYMHTHQGAHACASRSWPGQDVLMSAEDLAAAYPWPEDRPKLGGEAGASGSGSAAGPEAGAGDGLDVPGDDIGDILGHDLDAAMDPTL